MLSKFSILIAFLCFVDILCILIFFFLRLCCLPSYYYLLKMRNFKGTKLFIFNLVPKE